MLSQTAHPFPGDAHIVRDFSENQIEINTGVNESIEAAIKELEGHTRRIQEKLKTLPEPELLWPFSNPPYIGGEKDVPIAQFDGKDAHKTCLLYTSIYLPEFCSLAAWKISLKDIFHK